MNRTPVYAMIAFAVLGQSLMPALAGVVARRAGLDAIVPMLLVSSTLLFLLNEGMTRYRSAHEAKRV